MPVDRCSAPPAAPPQPFRLEVTPAALVVMDAHAHMCTNEVIGFLGGSFDPQERVLRVATAFPGRGRASGRDVEMDPVAEVEARYCFLSLHATWSLPSTRHLFLLIATSSNSDLVAIHDSSLVTARK